MTGHAIGDPCAVHQGHISMIVKEIGRAGEIRTHDLLHPMQAFYQAELRPDLFARLQSSPAGRVDIGES